jgi:Matrixin
MKRYLLVLFLAASAQAQLQFVFDYSLDSEGFFTDANSGRQACMQAAGDYVSSILSPTALSAINPTGPNTWSPTFTNPGTGSNASSPGFSITINTIYVYVGARSLGGGVLGSGGGGGFSASGSSAWFSEIRYRGNDPYDTGWGGSMAFDTGTSWYFDNDITSIESFPNQYDFFSVAVHELGHVLGLGTSPTWESMVNTATNPDVFTGAKSTTLFEGSVPLASGDAHWADNTMSTIFGTGVVQEAAMNPNIASNTRKYLTALDVAGLQDIGYTAVPEPAILSSGIALALALLGLRRGRSRFARSGI